MSSCSLFSTVIRPHQLVILSTDRHLIDAHLNLLRNMRVITHIGDNPANCLEHLGIGPTGIISIDMDTPGNRGWDFAGQLRTRCRATRIICISRNFTCKHYRRLIDLSPSDVVQRPFGASELQCALCRASQELHPSPLRRYQLPDGCHYLREERCVLLKGKRTRLTCKEAQLLDLFMQSRGTIVSQNLIARRIWTDRGLEVSNYSIKKLVQRLRDKLPPGSITTEYGRGYRMAPIHNSGLPCPRVEPRPQPAQSEAAMPR